nr:uncharacterized mitochondrial protein AtMg00810-like [Tanacetum cinerariifolium]
MKSGSGRRRKVLRIHGHLRRHTSQPSENKGHSRNEVTKNLGRYAEPSREVGSTKPVPLSAKPTEKHLKEVKMIFRYLRGTVNTGLWYTKDSSFELTGFSDADYAGCKDTFKSTFGGAQFLDGLPTGRPIHQSSSSRSFQLSGSSPWIKRWRYNLIPAGSKFKIPCSIIKDKYMMKAQVHVSKSSAISDVQALP